VVAPSVHAAQSCSWERTPRINDTGAAPALHFSPGVDAIAAVSRRRLDSHRAISTARRSERTMKSQVSINP